MAQLNHIAGCVSNGKDASSENQIEAEYSTDKGEVVASLDQATARTRDWAFRIRLGLSMFLG